MREWLATLPHPFTAADRKAGFGVALRTETTINDTRDFDIARGLPNLAAFRQVGFQLADALPSGRARQRSLTVAGRALMLGSAGRALAWRACRGRRRGRRIRSHQRAAAVTRSRIGPWRARIGILGRRRHRRVRRWARAGR